MSDQLMHFLHNMSGNCYFLAISPTPLAYRAEVANYHQFLIVFYSEILAQPCSKSMHYYSQDLIFSKCLK